MDKDTCRWISKSNCKCPSSDYYNMDVEIDEFLPCSECKEYFPHDLDLLEQNKDEETREINYEY